MLPIVNGSPSIRVALREDPAVRRIIRSWRTLTGGKPVRDPERRTLMACSAGVDSSALAIALAVASRHVVLGHVVHDLRPAPEASADAIAASELADRLGVPFVRCSIAVAALTGNAEHNARVHRYRALAALAKGQACPFIATGHHADDQLETMLMRLIRGGSIKALAGIRERRSCHGATLLRPSLGVTREDCERICTIAGWKGASDATNEDLTRTRARLRAQVMPVLRAIRPAAALRAVSLARMLDSAAHAIEDQALDVVNTASRAADGVWSIGLSDLRSLRAAVQIEVLVALHARVCRDVPSRDRSEIRGDDLDRAVAAIAKDASDVRRLRLGDMTLTIGSREVAARLDPTRLSPRPARRASRPPSPEE